MVSTLKAWYGDAAKKDNEFAFNFVPKPASNASWMTIYDQALKGKMEGLLLSGMTAACIGPDSNQVQSALGKLKWLVIMDALPTTSSEFWRAPGADPSQIKTEVFMLPPRTGSRRTDRSSTAAAGRSGKIRSCRPRARRVTTTGSWPSSFSA